MSFRYFFISLLPIVLLSCQKDPQVASAPVVLYPGVDQNLWPYWESFEREAQSRGLEFDLAEAGITASIEPLHDGNVIGRCQYGRFVTNHITIDRPYWNRSGRLGREMVVFHELGHCFLGRGHTESAFGNGLCQSIMRSGTCCCRDAYSSNNRTYYLDELFGVD